MKIAITGAGGSQQSAMARGLATAGHQVMGLARDGHPELEGVTWVRGSATDRDALAELLTDADVFSFHLPVSDPTWPAAEVLELVASQGIKRVLFNASSRVPGPGEPQQPSNAVVAELERHGFEYTAFQPTLYLENLLLPIVLDDLREGVLRYPLPATGFAVAWFATVDLGPLAVAALREGTRGPIGAPGARALTGLELAAALGQGLGRDVRFESITPEAFGERLATVLGEGPARTVQGLYAGIAAAPAAFEPWLAPHGETTALARAVGPTSAAHWASTTLRGLLSP